MQHTLLRLVPQGGRFVGKVLGQTLACEGVAQALLRSQLPNKEKPEGHKVGWPARFWAAQIISVSLRLLDAGHCRLRKAHIARSPRRPLKPQALG